MIKSCGGCEYWVKWRKAAYKLKSDGLCQVNDWRVSSDYTCASWKGIKYERIKLK